MKASRIGMTCSPWQLPKILSRLVWSATSLDYICWGSWALCSTLRLAIEEGSLWMAWNNNNQLSFHRVGEWVPLIFLMKRIVVMLFRWSYTLLLDHFIWGKAILAIVSSIQYSWCAFLYPSPTRCVLDEYSIKKITLQIEIFNGIKKNFHISPNLLWPWFLK